MENGKENSIECMVVSKPAVDEVEDQKDNSNEYESHRGVDRILEDKEDNGQGECKHTVDDGEDESRSRYRTMFIEVLHEDEDCKSKDREKED